MGSSKLINGDSADELKKLEDDSVDLLCTDPPYGYSFMGKSWDKMLPPKEIFEESLRVLKPGSFAFVMSAPRSDVQSRMIQMLEDVGFEVGFTPIYWTYATGFPKAMNIGKAVDKRLGKERKVIGKKPGTYADIRRDENTGQDGWGGETVSNRSRVESYITTPASDEAKKLEGSYGGYQPKPAIEVVIVAMKPLSQKGYLDQALDNQKGITWLDDCRIPFAGMNDQEQFDKDNVAGMMNFDEKYEKGEGKMYEGGWEKPTRTSTKSESSPLGRFAANLLVSDDVLNVESKGQLAPTTGNEPSNYKENNTHGSYLGYRKEMKPRNDGNSFSRYYSLDAWWNSRLSKLPDEVKNTFPFLVVPKASKGEKNMGLDKFEVKEKDTRTDTGKGSFTEKGLQPGKNIHPTVKPMDLMSYLVTLGSRKDDVVLDPFMGSGTTPMACVTLSRNYIGIEREDEYFKIAEARVNKLENPIKQWEQWI
jgi:site-specific DNA-methyltransferase (adenine-specific)